MTFYACVTLARVFKRKQKQAIVFRSKESLSHTCTCMSITYTMRNSGKDAYAEITEIFNRPKPVAVED